VVVLASLWEVREKNWSTFAEDMFEKTEAFT